MPSPFLSSVTKPMPSFIASLVFFILTLLPSKYISPFVLGPLHKSTVEDDVSLNQVHLQNQVSPPGIAWNLCHRHCRRLNSPWLPGLFPFFRLKLSPRQIILDYFATIIETISSWFVWEVFLVPIFSPSLRTVILSESLKASSSLWNINNGNALFFSAHLLFQTALPLLFL